MCAGAQSDRHRRGEWAPAAAGLAENPENRNLGLKWPSRECVFRWATMRPFLKTLAVLALGLSIAGCVPTQPPYPNVVPIDTTGNFGAH